MFRKMLRIFDTKDESTPKANDDLDKYMMELLNSSRAYGNELIKKAESTISYFIIFISAISGIVIGVLTSETTSEIQKSASLLFGSFLVGSVGTLVYIWEFTFYTLRRIEGLLQVICHSYFRKKDPDTYDMYGLPSLLTILRRQKNPNFLPLFLQSGMISILTISVFSSTMLALSLSSLYYLINEAGLYFPTIFNISVQSQSLVLFVILISTEIGFGLVQYNKTINTYQIEVNKILQDLAL